MQLLVLGCHRSGTSALTRLLNMMGASVGAPESMKAANKENPKGFWENDEVVDVNKLLLQQAGARWDRLSTFSEECAATAFAQAAPTLGLELERLVLRFDLQRPWVTKDPRMCLTLPFWLPYLELPVVILMNRHPVEVARSMGRRSPLLTLETGIALWEKYSLCALADSRGIPRAHMTHEALMRDPLDAIGTLKERLESLGVEGLRIPLAAELTAFIDPKLYRERVLPESDTALLNPAQRRLHEALSSGEALAWTEIPELSAESQAALQAYDAAATAEPERLLAVNRWNLGRLLETRVELMEFSRRALRAEGALERLKSETVELKEKVMEQTRSLNRAAERAAEHEGFRAKYAERCALEAEYREEAKALRGALQAVYRELRVLDGSIWTRLGLRVKLLRGLLFLGPLRPEMPIDRARTIYERQIALSDARLQALQQRSQDLKSSPHGGGPRPNRHAYQEDFDRLQKIFDRLVWCIEAMDRQWWWRLSVSARKPFWAAGVMSDSNRRTVADAKTLKQQGAALFAQAGHHARRGKATRDELDQDLKKLFQAVERMIGHIQALRGSKWWRRGEKARAAAGQLGLMKREFRLPTMDADEAIRDYKRLRENMAGARNRYVIKDENRGAGRAQPPETPSDRALVAKVFLVEGPGETMLPGQVHALMGAAGYEYVKFRVLASAAPDPSGKLLPWEVVPETGLAATLDARMRASDSDLRVIVRAGAELPQGWLAALLACGEADPMNGLLRLAGAAVALKRSVLVKCGPVTGLHFDGGMPVLGLHTPPADAGFSVVDCDLSTAATAPSVVMRPRAVDALLNLKIHTNSVFHQHVKSLCAQSAENLDPLFRESEDGIVKFVLANRHAGGQPLVSIIMPTYNRAGIVEESIRSVLEQTWQHWELLVCDDGSEDGTRDAVHAFADGRIRLLELPHGGAAKARNAGLAEAAGEYIAYLDSDNLWHPAFLEVMIGELMRHTGHYCVFSKYLDVVVRGEDAMELKRHTDADFSYEQLQARNFVDLNSFVHRASLYREFGGFTDALPRMQDWDLVLKYTYLRDPLYVDAYLTFYRRNEAWGQITTTQRHRDEEARGRVAANLEAYYKAGLPVVRKVEAMRKVTILSWDICRNHFSKAYNVAEALHRSGRYQVQLIGFRFFEEPIFEPYEGVKPPFETLYFEGATLPEFETNLARALMAVKGDLVYCVKPRFPSLGLGLLANYHFGRPVVMEANDSEVHVHKAGTGAEDTPLDPETGDPSDAAWRNPHSLEWSRMMDGFARTLPWIVTHNQNLDAHYGSRSFYIRNLKDEDWFDPERYDREAIRRELGFKPEDRVILFGGLIRRHKGVFTLVDLVRELGADQYKLLFVGSRNSPDLDKLKAEYANETVILPPQGRNEMAKINYAADLVVLWLDPDVPASRYQMPYKLTDALAMKVPVIANDISDLGPLGHQGFLRLVPHGDMEELLQTVRAVFDDPKETQRMVEAGRRLYLRQFCYAAAARNFDLIWDAATRAPSVLPEAGGFAEWYARVHEAVNAPAVKEPVVNEPAAEVAP